MNGSWLEIQSGLEEGGRLVGWIRLCSTDADTNVREYNGIGEFTSLGFIMPRFRGRGLMELGSERYTEITMPASWSPSTVRD